MAPAQRIRGPKMGCFSHFSPAKKRNRIGGRHTKIGGASVTLMWLVTRMYGPAGGMFSRPVTFTVPTTNSKKRQMPRMMVISITIPLPLQRLKYRRYVSSVPSLRQIKDEGLNGPPAGCRPPLDRSRFANYEPGGERATLARYGTGQSGPPLATDRCQAVAGAFLAARAASMGVAFCGYAAGGMVGHPKRRRSPGHPAGAALRGQYPL